MRTTIFLLLITAAAVLLIFFNQSREIEAEGHYRQTLEAYQKINTEYELELEILKEKMNSLNAALSMVQDSLQRQRKKLKDADRRLTEALGGNWDSIPTEKKLAECDTLRLLVMDYKQEVELSDSIAEVERRGFTELLSVKDHSIAQQNKALEQIRTLLKDCIAENQTLSLFKEKHKKKTCWQKIKSTCFAVGAIIAGTLAIRTVSAK